MSKVTIVVPIYNVEKYLKACFDSLLQQTSDAYEVLAISDGSPDNSKEIMDFYAQKYPEKIHVLYKENGGYGSVLQKAISIITTPYFLVCDPDDTLEPTAVEQLLKLANMSGADISIGAKSFVYDGSVAKDYSPSYNTEFTRLHANHIYHKGSSEFDDLFFVDPSPHAKLYRTSLAKNIVFPEKVGYTDNLLFYISLLQAKKVIYSDQSMANYLVDRPGNTMTDVSVKAMKGMILVFKTIVTQASVLKDVPDMFWYRMFESFKYMLYQTKRLNATLEEYGLVMDELETYLAKLIPFSKKITPIYQKYTKTRLLEKLRDISLLQQNLSAITYARLKKRMLESFRKV